MVLGFAVEGRREKGVVKDMEGAGGEECKREDERAGRMQLSDQSGCCH